MPTSRPSENPTLAPTTKTTSSPTPKPTSNPTNLPTENPVWNSNFFQMVDDFTEKWSTEFLFFFVFNIFPPDNRYNTHSRHQLRQRKPFADAHLAHQQFGTPLLDSTLVVIEFLG